MRFIYEGQNLRAVVSPKKDMIKYQRKCYKRHSTWLTFATHCFAESEDELKARAVKFVATVEGIPYAQIKETSEG